MKSFKNFLFAGCSHTAGSEIFYPKMLGDVNAEKEGAFGAVVSKALGKKYYNIAQPGCGNQYIARSVLFWLLDNKEEINDTFIIIHWTGETRLDFSYQRRDKEKWVAGPSYAYDCFDMDQICIMPNGWSAGYPYRVKNTLKYLERAVALESEDRTWLLIDKYTTVLWMQELLKQMGVQYLFFNGYDNLENSKRYKIYVDHIDTTKFIEPYRVGGGFYERAINAGFESKAQYMHHQEPAHIWYANWLLENHFTRSN